MNTPTDLLETKAECESFNHEELFEATPGIEKSLSEEVFIISGTLTISP